MVLILQNHISLCFTVSVHPPTSLQHNNIVHTSLQCKRVDSRNCDRSIGWTIRLWVGVSLSASRAMITEQRAGLSGAGRRLLTKEVIRGGGGRPSATAIRRSRKKTLCANKLCLCWPGADELVIKDWPHRIYIRQGVSSQIKERWLKHVLQFLLFL